MKVDYSEKFTDRISITDYCWNWTGKIRKDGYGMFWYKGKEVRAHRFAANEFNPKVKVLHSCDNPRCVNPMHLFKGTQKDNIEDMLRKGRGSPYFTEKGADNPAAKLTREQVIEIRSKYKPYKYSTQKLAKEYNMAQQTIWKIVKHKRYLNM